MSQAHSKRYYIGYDVEPIQVTVQKPDKYEYERWLASRRLKMPEWDLPDEPDLDYRIEYADEQD